ncbi:MAG TPA: prepilin-type N-terminal cleavage/methylation domain-containing protein [Burkholderiales bacterium]|nr:prepilin-type N-terminal cleavage/methylation domain-containing protein [Burkholderiales bacterium]
MEAQLRPSGHSFRASKPLPHIGAGFTLVELMLAIAILAVLVAIAVPSYQSYSERIKVQRAESDIILMSAAIDLYERDNQEYPNNLAVTGNAGMLDPWGRPYQYLRLVPLDGAASGLRRKDRNLVPINSDYDLYSTGKDGDSRAPLTVPVSRDDIIRANNGRFVGLASDY